MMKLESMDVSNFFVEAVVMKLSVKVTCLHLLGSLVLENGFEVGVICLDAWRDGLIAKLEASRGYQHFRMPRISFIADASVVQIRASHAKCELHRRPFMGEGMRPHLLMEKMLPLR